MDAMLTQAQSRAPISARLVANMMQTAGANRMLPRYSCWAGPANTPHRHRDRGPPCFSGELWLHASQRTLLTMFTDPRYATSEPCVQRHGVGSL